MGSASAASRAAAEIAAAATTATRTTTAAAATAAEAAATTAATRTGTTLFRFVHAKGTAVEIGAVHALDRLRRVIRGRHGHERETARAARIAVEHQVHFRDLATLSERALEDVFGGVEGKVAYVQSGVHLSISALR